MEKKNILMLGATDRMNYGDLLFPIILEEVFNRIAKNDNISIAMLNYSTTNSDLSFYGALPTKSFFKMYRYLKNNENCHLVVVGGGVLAVNWLLLYSMVSPVVYFIEKMRFYKSNKIKNIISKYLFEKNSLFPFVIERNNFPSVKSLSYNSVGDTYHSPIGLLSLVNKNSDYFSVRSKADFDYLETDLKNKTLLVPDSAILMSSLWTKEELKSKVRGNFVTETEKYIFFQINLYHIEKYGLNLISDQLEEVYKATNCKIVLCSIGTALRHNDDTAISKLSKNLKVSHSVYSHNTLWEIMYLIANSSFYIGTSLHGVITAMSFSVPYIGFESVNKQANFISTWSIPELCEIVSISDFSRKVINFFKNEDLLLIREKMKKRTNELQVMSYSSIDKIFSIIKNK